MKKSMLLVLSALLVMGMSGAVFAGNYSTPAEIYSELTGETLEDVYELRSSGKTYGELAEEKGLLKEFEEAALESKKEVLKTRVAEGSITQERADELVAIWEDADCDEPGHNNLGKEAGLRFGSGNGNGLKDGSGGGRGNGNGLHDGSGNGLGIHRWNQE